MYEPEVRTVIDGVVSPVDQVFPVTSEDVKITEPPSQNVVAPLAVITGGATVVTVTVAETAEEQPLELTVTS